MLRKRRISPLLLLLLIILAVILPPKPLKGSRLGRSRRRRKRERPRAYLKSIRRYRGSFKISLRVLRLSLILFRHREIRYYNS